MERLASLCLLRGATIELELGIVQGKFYRFASIRMEFMVRVFEVWLLRIIYWTIFITLIYIGLRVKP